MKIERKICMSYEKTRTPLGATERLAKTRRFRAREWHSPGGFQEPTANPRMPRGARVHVASLGRLSSRLQRVLSSSSSARRAAPQPGAAWAADNSAINSRSQPDERKTVGFAASDCGSSRDLRRADTSWGPFASSNTSESRGPGDPPYWVRFNRLR
ncbi:hypothetical protein DBV15_03043 [Temnothorax longispinosus]|uniref:Uncharacterized protein n=1 Tax=Temnothorax longispinosus TaxID=300112 RepID=A0A4V3S9Z3_9HYME|nr:hypothetical protein DBV15_03043 [Temnothorax longispinosus]